MQPPVRIAVEVDADSPAGDIVADWLRSWRRRGVRPDGKTLYPDQGASTLRRFHAPPQAVADLELRLANDRSATVTREPAADAPRK